MGLAALFAGPLMTAIIVLVVVVLVVHYGKKLLSDSPLVWVYDKASDII